VTKTTTTLLISKQLSNLKGRKRLALKPSMDPERIIWPSYSKKIMHSKRQLQLKPEKTASSKKTG
jgi:hypothetical protein